MCGISLSIAKKNIDIAAFNAFNSTVKHRGPDDEGFIFIDADAKVTTAGGFDTPTEVWHTTTNYHPENKVEAVQGDYKVAFGHRRLSIMDLSPLGHLPMCDSSKRYWITFNGEVYNFVELRGELEQLGHTFLTQGDTEVIIAAYAQWGAACLNRFIGMWALAIYDTVEQTVFISRDRYGIKPLYYWFSPEGDFYAGSEIKQFTAVSGWEARLNPQRVYDYLFYSMTDHTDETMFANVYTILPGHSANIAVADLVSKNGKLATQKWYQPKKANFTGTFEEACSTFHKHFDAAVDLHLRADVAVGSALSGGLDSSAIVCAVNKKLHEQGVPELQQTFSSCSHDKRFDEKQWMDKVIEATNVDATFVYPEGKDIFELTEKLIWHQDEPYQSQSAFLAYRVFEAANKNKVTVLLNGQGADEYLSGYGAFSNFRKMRLFREGKWKTLYDQLNGNSFKEKLSDSQLMFYQLLPKKLVRQLSKLKSQKLHSIIDVEKLGAKNEHPHDKAGLQFTSIFNIAHYQMLFEPLQKYLRWEDRNSMAHSIEARVPFLDHRMVEFTTSLPVDYLDGVGDAKKVMKYGLSDILPEAIRNRKDKKGFITPEEIWFKQDFTSEFIAMFKKYNTYTNSIIKEKEALAYFDDVISGKAPFDYTYWRFISLGIWMKVFNVKP